MHGSFYFFGFSGVSISSDEQQNVSATLLKEVGYFFSRKRKHSTSFYIAVNKKYIIKSKCKLILCFHKSVCSQVLCYALVMC